MFCKIPVLIVVIYGSFHHIYIAAQAMATFFCYWNVKYFLKNICGYNSPLVRYIFSPLSITNVSWFFQSVVSCMWHPKINQILAGCGNGKVKVFFDPQRSTRYLVMKIHQYLMSGGGGGGAHKYSIKTTANVQLQQIRNKADFESNKRTTVVFFLNTDNARCFHAEHNVAQ